MLSNVVIVHAERYGFDTDFQSASDDEAHNDQHIPNILLGMVINIDEINSTLHLHNIAYNEPFSVSLQSETVIYDRDGHESDFFRLRVGDILDITVNEENENIADQIAINSYVWEMPFITGLEIDFDENTIVTNNGNFNFTPNLLAVNNNMHVSLEAIQSSDEVTIYGLDNVVWFIEVHTPVLPADVPEGYLNLIINVDEAVVYIGNDEILDVSGPILLTFGYHDIRVWRQGYYIFEETIYFNVDNQTEVIHLEPIVVQRSSFPVARDTMFYAALLIIMIVGLTALAVIWVRGRKDTASPKPLGAKRRHKSKFNHNDRPKEKHDHSDHAYDDHTAKDSQKKTSQNPKNIIIKAEKLTTKLFYNRYEYDFAICAGDMVYVVGKSGSGKTILLKILGGYDKKISGGLWFWEEDTWKRNDKALKRFIGYVPQMDSLYSDLTPFELLRYYNKLFSGGLKRSEIDNIFAYLNREEPDERNKIRDILDLLGLKGKESEKIESLSGGERKRVSIAVELLKHPHILLLDEPDSGLDPDSRKELYKILDAINAIGTTVILSTHYQDNIKDNEGNIKQGFENLLAVPAKSTPKNQGKVEMWRKSQESIKPEKTEEHNAKDSSKKEGRKDDK